MNSVPISTSGRAEWSGKTLNRDSCQVDVVDGEVLSSHGQDPAGGARADAARGAGVEVADAFSHLRHRLVDMAPHDEVDAAVRETLSHVVHGGVADAVPVDERDADAAARQDLLFRQPVGERAFVHVAAAGGNGPDRPVTGSRT